MLFASTIHIEKVVVLFAAESHLKKIVWTHDNPFLIRKQISDEII